MCDTFSHPSSSPTRAPAPWKSLRHVHRPSSEDSLLRFTGVPSSPSFQNSCNSQEFSITGVMEHNVSPTTYFFFIIVKCFFLGGASLLLARGLPCHLLSHLLPFGATSWFYGMLGWGPLWSFRDSSAIRPSGLLLGG